MFVFNSGMGGYKCDYCSVLIAGDIIKKKLIKGNDLHYCSSICEKLHYLKDKADRKKDVKRS